MKITENPMTTVHQKLEDKMLKRMDKLQKKSAIRTRSELIRVLLDEAITARGF